MFCFKKIYARAIQDYLIHLTSWMFTLSVLVIGISLINVDAQAQTPPDPCPGQCRGISVATIADQSSQISSLVDILEMKAPINLDVSIGNMANQPK